MKETKLNHERKGEIYQENYGVGRGGLSDMTHIKFRHVKTVRQFEEAEAWIDKPIYPSRQAEKNRIIRVKTKIRINKNNLDYWFDDLLSQYVLRLDKKQDHKDLEEGQFLKYLAIDSIAKVVSLKEGEEFTFKFIQDDSAYTWSFFFRKPILWQKRAKIKGLYTVKLPVTAEYSAWRGVKGRFAFTGEIKGEFKIVKKHVRDKDWKLQ